MIKYLCASFIALSASLLAMDEPSGPYKRLEDEYELVEVNTHAKKLPDSPRKPRKESRSRSGSAVAKEESRSRSNSAARKESRSPRPESIGRIEFDSPRASLRRRVAEQLFRRGKAIITVFSSPFIDPETGAFEESTLKVGRLGDDLVIEAVGKDNFIFDSRVPKRIITRYCQEKNWKKNPHKSQSTYGFKDKQSTVKHVFFAYFSQSPSNKYFIENETAEEHARRAEEIEDSIKNDIVKKYRKEYMSVKPNTLVKYFLLMFQ